MPANLLVAKEYRLMIDQRGRLVEQVISGDVFDKVVQRYQICSPTMMVRREVFVELGGYDPKLKYEDYDFFIRASRSFKFYFLDYISVHKRELKDSDSKGFYRRNENPHLQSTLVVLKKYLWLCKSNNEKEAALYSIRYHMRQALFMECYWLVAEYFELIQILNNIKTMDRLIMVIARNKISLNNFYSLYRKLRFG